MPNKVIQPKRQSIRSPTFPSTRSAQPFVHATGTEILDRLWRSCHEGGQTVVLVTHDAKAAAYADRVYVLRDGSLRDEIRLGRREDHGAAPLIARLADLGL